MADHLRTQIRKAMVALLKGKNADVADRVFTGRAHPLQENQVPAADVDFGTFEGRHDGGRIESDPISDPTRVLDRYPVLTLALTVKQGTGYLDMIDAIYADYEPAIANNNTLGGLCARISPIGEPRNQVSGEGDQTVVRSEMYFEVEYMTAFDAPTVAA